MKDDQQQQQWGKEATETGQNRMNTNPKINSAPLTNSLTSSVLLVWSVRNTWVGLSEQVYLQSCNQSLPKLMESVVNEAVCQLTRNIEPTSDTL